MKYWILFIVVGLSVSLFSCDDKQQQQNVDWVSVDDEIIQDYLQENNITAEKHPSGLYYRIVNEGNGQHPNATSFVKVNYEGYLIDGTVFDQNDGLEFSLGNVIQGWKIGIPLISKGGSAQLFIPSYLGYGSRPQQGIPANSVLIFDVDLLNF